jgi:hypothetical protein
MRLPALCTFVTFELFCTFNVLNAALRFLRTAERIEPYLSNAIQAFGPAGNT